MDNSVKNEVLLSVCMITYNHEEFIAQAIDGVIMQKVNFLIELVIGEDCGTDRTREICIRYRDKYPDIIRLNFPDKNVGAQNNFINTIGLCSGKYIALCEGDDYWIDENKLQKQVDFLENNTEFVMSSHNAAILGHNKKMIYNPALKKNVLDIYDIICGNWEIMTASIVLRRDKLQLFNWFDNIKNGDYALQLTLASKGLIHYIPEYMSVYRRHQGGISLKFTPFCSSKSMYDLLKYFNKETKFKYNKVLKHKYQQLLYDKKNVAKRQSLRKQYIGLSIIYYFSKLKIDMMPIMARFFHYD